MLRTLSAAKDLTLGLSPWVPGHGRQGVHSLTAEELRHTDELHREPRDVDQRAVAKHDTLGVAHGAQGVLEHDRLFGIRRCRAHDLGTYVAARHRSRSDRLTTVRSGKDSAARAATAARS